MNAAAFPDHAAPRAPAPATAPARRSRATRIALWIGGAVALYALLVGVALPPLAKKLVADKLGEQLGRTVVLEHLSINPFTLVARAKDFRILEADGRTPFVAFDRLEADASVTSAWRLAPVVDALTLEGLKVNLVRETGERFNFSDILSRLAQAGEAARRKRGTADEDEARFSVSNIRVAGARIDVDDRVKSVKHAVSDMDVTIPFVSNLPAHLKEYVQPAFAAKVNGATVRLRGETLPFEDTLRTHFKIGLAAVDIRRYLEYIPVALPFRIDAGVMDADVSVSFTQAGGKQPTIDIAGTAALRDFAASTAQGPLARFARLEADVASFDPLQGRGKVNAVILRDAQAMGEDAVIPLVEVRDVALDMKKKQLRVASVATQDGKVALKRNRDGSIEMPKLVPVGGQAAPAPVAEPQPPATPWDLAIARATVSGYQVTLADAAVKPAANHRIVVESLVAEDLSTRDLLSGKANAKVAINKGGALDVAATFALDPLLVEATVDARRIDLVPLRPYVKEFQTVALDSGSASAKGKATLRGKGDALHVAYRGSAEVANLATVDTVGREDLLKWKSVRTSGIDFDMAPNAPLKLAVAEIVVDRIYSRVILNADGKLNLQQLRSATPQDPQPAVAAAPPRPREVRIDRITFVDGRLNFTDLFIRPNYTADVGGLQGSVNGLSSAADARATVDLKGRYDRTSPVVIAGTVNPLRGDLFLDIAARGSDVELPRLSAYSARYAGYGITGGKLNLDVKYHIDGGKMEGRNRIMIDQLTFGEKVESPEATKLPVLFAVNLLKDAKGQINLELPVSGSLDDPQFEVAALVTQVLGNLLKKAVTAPFSLLAAALGGGSGGSGAASGDGGDMAYVEFQPGSSELAQAEQQKLDRLVKALQDRPGIKLELAAHADAGRDAEALRRAELRKRVAAANESEYASRLKALYLAEGLAPARPKDSKEPPKEPGVAEMEAAVLERIEIGEEQLKALALARGEQAKGYLVASGRLPADRVLVATSAAGEPSSRVAFALR